MPTGARLILAIDLGLAAVFVGSIVVRGFLFFRHRRQSASQE